MFFVCIVKLKASFFSQCLMVESLCIANNFGCVHTFANTAAWQCFKTGHAVKQSETGYLNLIIVTNYISKSGMQCHSD